MIPLALQTFPSLFQTHHVGLEILQWGTRLCQDTDNQIIDIGSSEAQTWTWLVILIGNLSETS